MDNENIVLEKENVKEESVEKKIIGYNVTRIRRATYEQLYKLITSRNFRTFYICILISIISGVLVLLFGNEDNRLVAYAAIGLGVVFFPMLLLFSKKTISTSIDKVVEANQNSSFEYTFYEDSIKLRVKTDSQDIESEADYATFYKIVENELFIFVFVNPRAVFPVDKEDFKDNSYEKVVEQLKLHVNKYVDKTKKTKTK